MLTHVDKKGNAKMVDISSKKDTQRMAEAKGSIKLTPKIMQSILKDINKKGDVLTVAKIAGIQGGKRTSELIPLCHPLHIDNIATKIIMHENDFSLEVFCTVSAVTKTGVEMEAIMGVNTALITIYDLSKIINPHLRIDCIRLLIKEGGKSGLWKNPDGLPSFLEDVMS